MSDSYIASITTNGQPFGNRAEATAERYGRAMAKGMELAEAHVTRLLTEQPSIGVSELNGPYTLAFHLTDAGQESTARLMLVGHDADAKPAAITVDMDRKFTDALRDAKHTRQDDEASHEAGEASPYHPIATQLQQAMEANGVQLDADTARKLAFIAVETYWPMLERSRLESPRATQAPSGGRGA